MLGPEIRMDDNGNSEGNFTVLALDDQCNVIIPYTSTNYTINCSHCMKTVGKFYLGPGALPVSGGRHAGSHFVSGDTTSCRSAALHT